MKISQCDRIIEYIEKHGSITQLEAYLDISCFRLASRIADIKRKGIAIKTEIVKVKNRYDEPVSVARYSFAEVGNANNRV